MTPEEMRLRRRALMSGLEDPEGGATDPAAFEGVPGLMSGLMAQRPRPPAPPPSPVQSAAMSVSNGQRPGYDTGLENPEVGASDPRAFESTIGGVGKMLPPITDQPLDELALAGLDEATRTPATSSYSGRPADQLAPGESDQALTGPPDMTFSLAEAEGPVARAAQPGQSRQQARPQFQADQGQYDPGPAPTSEFGTALKQLPNVIGNLVMAKSMGKTRPEYGKLQSIQGRNAQNAQIVAGDEEARGKFAQRKQYLSRLKNQDELAAADRADVRLDRQEARQDRAVARKLSDAARDPNSDKNKLFRQAVARAYPEIRESLGPNFDTLTIADAHTIQPLLEKGKAKAEAEAKEGVRLQKNKDREDYYLFRQAHKRPTVNVGMSLRGGSPEQMRADMEKALGEMYGGEDKVPAEVRQRVALANALPAGKRVAAYDRILSQAPTAKRLEESAEASRGIRGQQLDFQERKEYERRSSIMHGQAETFKRSDALFKSIGLDMDKYKGGDVEGYGRLETFLHSALQGDKGQMVRQRMKQHISDLARAQSGLAYTDNERRNYEEIAGAAKGMSDEALVRGYLELKEKNRIERARLDEFYPEAAKINKRAMAKANAPTGTTPLFDKAGKVFYIPDAEVDEALADPQAGLTRGE